MKAFFDHNLSPYMARAFHAAGGTGFFFRPGVARLTVLEQTAAVLWHWQRMVPFVEVQERGAYWLPVNKSSRFAAIGP